MKKISVDELHALMDSEESVTLIDVREPFEFKGAFVAGAENVPMGNLGEAAPILREKGVVHVLCNTGVRSEGACQILESAGVNVVGVEGGLSAWKAKGFKTEGVGERMPVMRQVLLIAGLCVLVSTALGFIVHPTWHYVAGAVGAGLTFAGATGICGMTYVLRYMPWNR